MERDGLQQFMEQAKHRILTREEEAKLARAAKQGDQHAYNTLVLHNVRLVYSIARKYVPGPLPLDDLIQEGMFGLMHGVRKFDPERGFKLSTYATWWIKQAVQRAIHNKGRTIRLPVHLGQRLETIKRRQAVILAREGREASLEELAELTNLTVAQVEHALSVEKHTLSLDGFTGDDGESLDEIPTWDDEPDFADGLVEHASLKAALDRLPARERRVVELRYGLDGSEGWTLEAIGRDLGVTRARVQQIEAKALVTLRSYLRVAA